MTDPVLEFLDVSHAYHGGQQALAALHFRVCRGEAVALCGSNGSGKTTLLKLAGGLFTPTHGSVTLAGQVLDARNRKTAFQHIGLLFHDSDDQLFCTTVEEDIAYGPTNLGLPREEIAARVCEALETMQITHLARRPIHHLSAGEKKRTALAGLLALSPAILVLDEPTNGLDPTGVKEFIALLCRLNRQQGHTLVVATHEMDRVPEFATRVVVLNNGGIAANGPVHAVLTDLPLLAANGLDAPLITRYYAERRKLTGTTGRLPLTLEEALAMEEVLA